jgi:hypothetical protein
MNIEIQSVAISGNTAKMIGEAAGVPKEIDLPLPKFEQFCRDNPDRTFPFDILLTKDHETDEPTIYMIEVEK